MIEKLSWNVQKEDRFRTNAFLGSKSGSRFQKRMQRQKKEPELWTLELLASMPLCSYETHVFSLPSAFGISQSPESRKFLIRVCLSDRESPVLQSILVVVQVASTCLGRRLFLASQDPDLLPKKAFVLKQSYFCAFHDRFSIIVATPPF